MAGTSRRVAGRMTAGVCILYSLTKKPSRTRCSGRLSFNGIEALSGQRVFLANNNDPAAQRRRYPAHCPELSAYPGPHTVSERKPTFLWLFYPGLRRMSSAGLGCPRAISRRCSLGRLNRAADREVRTGAEVDIEGHRFAGLAWIGRGPLQLRRAGGHSTTVHGRRLEGVKARDHDPACGGRRVHDDLAGPVIRRNDAVGDRLGDGIAILCAVRERQGAAADVDAGFAGVQGPGSPRRPRN